MGRYLFLGRSLLVEKQNRHNMHYCIFNSVHNLYLRLSKVSLK